MATADLLQCYNKACGAKFNPTENSPDSCRHHPGTPVFHDALKGWSCCTKRSTDFSDFLKIPGCTTGKHSNVKAVEESKPKIDSKNIPDIIAPSPTPINIVPEKRPNPDEPLHQLLLKTAASYSKEKATKAMCNESGDEIKLGTKCRNSGCDAAYTNSPADKSQCIHHSGTAVFHEGMKYWSCCKRKTSDFTAFLNQVGCARGDHLWKKPADSVVKCRYDWHQTGSHVNISIYAKRANAETSVFRSNPVKLEAMIDFEGDKHFSMRLLLDEVVNVEMSKVTVSGTKVEISLRKKTAVTWKKLGEVIETNNGGKEKGVENSFSEKENDKTQQREDELEGVEEAIFD